MRITSFRDMDTTEDFEFVEEKWESTSVGDC